jgi:hypothetical protein
MSKHIRDLHSHLYTLADEKKLAIRLIDEAIAICKPFFLNQGPYPLPYLQTESSKTSIKKTIHRILGNCQRVYFYSKCDPNQLPIPPWIDPNRINEHLGLSMNESDAADILQERYHDPFHEEVSDYMAAEFETKFRACFAGEVPSTLWFTLYYLLCAAAMRQQTPFNQLKALTMILPHAIPLGNLVHDPRSWIVRIF